MADFVKLGMENKYKEREKKSSRSTRAASTASWLVVSPAGLTSTPPYVEEVVAGSPAEKVGLRADDLILYVEGFSVPTIKVFRETLKAYGPDDEIRLQFQRGAKLESVKMKLAKQPKCRHQTERRLRFSARHE